MDLRMPGLDGAAATARIVSEHPGTRVLVLTTYDTDADILRAVEAGASGYLLKDTPRAELVGRDPRGSARRDRARSAGGRPADAAGCGRGAGGATS